MKTVLVCDDDEAILESLRIYLSNEGYKILTASNGREAQNRAYYQCFTRFESCRWLINKKIIFGNNIF